MRNARRATWVFALALAIPVAALAAKHPLSVSADGRHFEHVDHIVVQAEALGLTVGLLPTWGDKWHSRQDQPGPRIFDAENAEA